jgi:hypothetical protein
MRPDEKRTLFFRDARRPNGGRDPGPDDPLFFDPEASEPQPLPESTLEEEIVSAMEAAGIHPALIYAAKKTGRIVTESNKPHLTWAERKEWDDAIAEYHKLNPGPQ